MSRSYRYSANNCAKLYEFIRLVLGPDVPDYMIARKWNMDGKNFSVFKYGQGAVPNIYRLTQLAKVLGVNKHLVFDVACGTPPRKVFNVIKHKGRAKLNKLFI